MNKIMYLVAMLTIVLALAGSAYALDCCVPPYVGSQEDIHLGFFDMTTGRVEPISEAGNCVSIPPGDSLYQADCTDDTQPGSPIKSSILATGCCCDRAGTPQDFDKQLSTEELASISRIFCTTQSFTPAELGTYPSCIQACEQFRETEPPDPNVQDYYLVTGYVFSEVNGVRSPLQDAVVASLTPYNSVTTDSNGFFNLGETPGAASGANLFEATTTATNTLICDKDTVEIILVDETQINFTLNCWENEEVCQPNWVYSDWSDVCYPTGGTYYQTRTAEDLNNCNTLQGLEPTRRTVDEQGRPVCEGTGPLIGDCGDGKLVEGGNEQCDGELFLIPSSTGVYNATRNGAPQCSDWFGTSFSSGIIMCTPRCGYDYSNCANTCDPTRCRHSSQCGECEACVGNTVVCGSGCEDTTPTFLPAWLENEDTVRASRDVFELYDVSLAAGETIIDGVRYEEGTDKVTLKWQFDQGCVGEIYGYKIEICEEGAEGENTCLSGTRRDIVPILPQQTSYTIEGLEPQTSYCYNLCVLRRDGTSVCAVEDDAPYPCFETGVEACMTPGHEPGLNCVFDPGPNPGLGKAIPRGCTSRSFGGMDYSFTNLQLTDIEQARADCGEGKICVETPYIPSENLRGAHCREAEECALCNGLLGVYGNTGIVLDTLDCDEDQYKFQEAEDDVPTPNNNYGLCYQDDTKTPFLQFKTCDAITSCYDYKSEGSCENDPCFRFTTTNNSEFALGCTWDKYLTPTPTGAYQPETGIGVCRPTEPALHNCTICDTDSPIGFCNEQLCSLHGECYFKEDVTHYIIDESSAPFEAYFFRPRDNPTGRKDHLPSCLSEKDMSCFLYETQEDCERDERITLNVIYNDEGKRIFGDNTKITESNDRYGFGTCVWNDAWDASGESSNEGYGCNKDSDASHTAPTPIYLDECKANNLATQDCYQDNQPPRTQLFLREPDPQYGLPTYGQREIVNVEYSKQDNVWDPGDIKTYITLLPLFGTCQQQGCDPGQLKNLARSIQESKAQECLDAGCPLYPQTMVDEFDVEDLESGQYLFMFYSEDKARNLEVLNASRIYVDVQGPIITMQEPKIATRRVAEDIYESDVVINFSTSEEALCNATLVWDMNIDRRFRTGDFQQSGTQFDTLYYALRDGNYVLRVMCKDIYNNLATETLDITVDGDKSIFNPQPRRGILHPAPDDVIMSVQTNTSATCRFSPRKEPYADMPSANTFTSSMGGTVHTYNFNDYGAGQGSNEYNFYVACSFANGDVTQQQDGDLISFAIDSMAPITTVYYEGPTDWLPFTGSEDYEEQRTFKIVCEDANQLTPNYYYGCEEIRYCVGPYTSNINSFNPSRNCRDGAFTVLNEYTWKDDETYPYGEVEYSIPEDARMYLYYYSTDAQGHEEQLRFLNIKLVSTYFTAPQIEVTRLVE